MSKVVLTDGTVIYTDTSPKKKDKKKSKKKGKKKATRKKSVSNTLPGFDYGKIGKNFESGTNE